jgi:secreted trypsin-like serine protease
VAAAHLCAQGGFNRGACSGDSGGPLTMQAGARRILIGVVSWGDSDCWNSPAYPTVFARVSTYAPWISQWVPDMRKIPGGKVHEVQITGNYGVPAGGVAGVSLSLTVTGTEAVGYATVYPCGALPGTSTVNFHPDQARANAVITPVSAGGKVCIYATSPLHAIVDVNGWFPA